MAYLEKLNKLIATRWAMRQLQPGSFSVATIRHDDWCGIWKGEGCNCNPDISLPIPQDN